MREILKCLKEERYGYTIGITEISNKWSSKRVPTYDEIISAFMHSASHKSGLCRIHNNASITKLILDKAWCHFTSYCLLNHFCNSSLFNLFKFRALHPNGLVTSNYCLLVIKTNRFTRRLLTCQQLHGGRSIGDIANVQMKISFTWGIITGWIKY